VAPNLRGYAGSGQAGGAQHYRAKHLWPTVAALIENWARRSTCFVAHDWGGALAWNLAGAAAGTAQAPLVMINSPHPATFLRELRHNPAAAGASAYMSLPVRPDAQAAAGAGRLPPLWRS